MRIFRTGFVLGILAMVTGATAAQADLSGVRHFTYWLANPNPALIAASDFDMAIVDYSRDGSGDRAFTRADVAMMQRKPDGERRIVLSYMSVGEAEDYRFYWQNSWAKKPPKWLEAVNPDWAGNFKVRYWDPDWKRIIFGNPDAYLDRIIAAGFDGVYLDIIDAYWYFQEKGRKTAAKEMTDFVTEMAAYARARVPGFRFVPQNAEDLVVDADYLAIIDGLGKEDAFFGWDGEGVPNPDDSTAWVMKHLDMITAAGKPVFLIEYPTQVKRISEAYARGREAGLIPYATVRTLDRMAINPGYDPTVPGLLQR
ncbi:MAG: endo alpha-1,4 polygalactosaminidase [Minwuia sp.]|nr:endo alpha-1,4 polygalactosaminidase [Minwuia sp.]